MRKSHQHQRWQAIDRRTRARAIERLRSKREDAQLRQRRLAMLAELAGKIEAGMFTASFLMDAEAALLERNPRKQRLDLGTSRDART
jgi:hypothetical protein